MFNINKLFIIISIINIYSTNGLIEQQPIFTSQPSDTGPLFSGARGILQCSASGTPPITYRWLKNMQNITYTSSTNGVYLIGSVSKEDVAQYQCIATNPLGSVLSNKAQLSIAYIERPLLAYQTDKRVYDGQAAILQAPTIDSYPSPTYEWYAGDALIIPNQKFAISKSNSLVILATEKSDEKTYYVKAINVHTGNEIRSKDYHLYVQDDLYSTNEDAFDYESLHDDIIPPTFVVRPSDTIAKLNDNLVKFDCILNAKPLDQLDISWYKDGELIDFKTSKYRLYQMSRSLEIISISDQDAGEYTCSASFKQFSEVLNASAHLHVHVRPTFKTQPPSVLEVDIGKQVSLNCDGIANPRGNITWFKNAIFLDPLNSPKNIEISELSTRLSIRQIDFSDQGIYQCFITNEAGQISSSSLVKIISQAPRLVHKTLNVTSFSELSLTLKCEFDGSPRPSIKWFKENEDWSHLSNENGEFFIKSLSMRYKGWYTCRAENLLGMKEDEIYVDVKKKTEIIEPPMNISVIKGQSALLKCTISKEDDIEYELKWKLNDFFIDFNEKHDNLRLFSNGSLLIHEAKNTDIGVYRCIVLSQAGNDSSSAYLNVVELPYSPVNVHAELYTNIKRTVNISWSQAFDGNSLILKYIIQAHMTPYDSNLYDTTPTDWFVLRDNVAANQLWTLISDLMPAMAYKFRVSAVNEIGEGDVSVPSNNLTIPEEVPSGAPRNILAQALSSSAINIQWSLPSNNLWNGKIQGFIIAYSLSYPNSTWKMIRIQSDNQFAHNITDLIIWETYLIKLCAFNSRGLGVYSDPIRLRTKEGIPIKPPLQFKANPINSTCIRMSWTPPPPQFVNGVIQGYKLIVESNGKKTIDIIEANVVNHFKCDLAKFTFYSLSVSCFTNSGDGPATQPVRLTTLEDVPGEVSSINFVNVYDTSIELSWKEPNEPNGKILEYVLSYKESTASDFIQIRLNSSQFNFLINNLRASTEYVIGLYARTSAGNGLEKLTTIKSGVPPELPEPPKAIVVKNVDKRSVLLEFIPGYNGKTSISKWIIEARVDLSSIWTRIFEKSAPNATSLLVDSLSPFKNYTLRMYALNVKGKSEPSQMTESFQTLADVPSQAPSHVYARNLNHSSIFIKWTPIPTSHWNGLPIGYVISLNNDKKIFRTRDTQIVVNDLRAFNEYSIRIAAENSVGMSVLTVPVSVNTSSHVPSKSPTNINAIPLNYSSVQISWDPIASRFTHGDLLGYRIFVSHSKEKTIKQVESDAREVILTNLDGYSNYKIEICGYTQNGDGILSNPVSIRTPEHIPSQPANIYFPEVGLFAVRIKWYEPEKPNGLIKGYRLSYYRRNSNDIKTFYLASNVTDFYANGLKRMENYVFSLVANTSLGWGDEAQVQVFTIDKRSKPEAPGQPVIGKSSIKSNELMLNWNVGEENYSPIRYFTIECKKNNASWHVIKSNHDSKQPSMLVKNLSPNTNYYFRVSATNDVGKSDTSVESDLVKTKEDVPHLAPRDVIVSSLDMTSLKVTWSNATNISMNGQILKYKLKYSLFEVLVDYPKCEFIIKNLEKNAAYDIQVSAINSAGQGPWSKLIVHHMQDTEPTRAPLITKITPISSTEIQVEWMTPTSDSINGKLYGYKIYYIRKNTSDFGFHNTFVIDAGTNTTVLNKLKPYTNYTIFMQLFNQAGDSPLSNRLIKRTLESIPSQVSTIDFTYVGYTHLNVTIGQPIDANGLIQSYEISYENRPEKLGDKTRIIRQEVQANMTRLHIKDLEPRVSYIFKVRCRTSIGWSEWKESGVRTGPQVDSPIAPLKPSLISINESFILLEWKIQTKNYEYFQIRMKYVDANLDENIVGYSNEAKFFMRKTRIKSRCVFEVFAFNSKGISEPSASSDPLDLPNYSSILYDDRPMYYNWWFLVILALSVFTFIIIMIMILYLRGKNKKFIHKSKMLDQTKLGTQSTLIDPDNLYAPTSDLNPTCIYELRQSRRGGSGAASVANTLGRMSLYKNDTIKSLKHGGATNDYCTASKIGVLLNPNDTYQKSNGSSSLYGSNFADTDLLFKDSTKKLHFKNNDFVDLNNTLDKQKYYHKFSPQELSDTDNESYEAKNDNYTMQQLYTTNTFTRTFDRKSTKQQQQQKQADTQMNLQLKHSTYCEPTYFTHQTPAKQHMTLTKAQSDQQLPSNESVTFNGSHVVMSNIAGSRKPVTGFSSFV